MSGKSNPCIHFHNSVKQCMRVCVRVCVCVLYYIHVVSFFCGCLGENRSAATSFPTSIVRDSRVRSQPLLPTSSLPPAHPLYHHHEQQLPPEYESRRRSRTNFTIFQLDTLERAFSRRHYPDSSEVAALSYHLSISESRVQVTGIFFLDHRLARAPQLPGWPTVAKSITGFKL